MRTLQEVLNPTKVAINPNAKASVKPKYIGKDFSANLLLQEKKEEEEEQ